MRKAILQEYYGCVVQKTAEKNTKYSRNETILKIDHLAKALVHAKAIAICKIVSLGRKLKIPKTCEKRFYKSIRVVLCKKPLQKNTKHSRNETILTIRHLAKAKAHAKTIYSLCKLLSLGQK